MKTAALIPLCFALLITGCSPLTVSVKPEIEYGNPDYNSIKDLPAVKYKEEKFKEKSDGREISADEYEKMGDALFLKRNFFMAFLQYERSLKKNEKNLRVIYKKGLALLHGGKATEAKAQFDRVLKIHPDDAPAHEGLGRVSMKEKNYQKAKIHFKKAVALDPLLWRSYNYLGNIYDLQGEKEKAIREYRTAVTINPKAGFVFNNLGVSLAGAGMDRQAGDAFYNALKSGYGPQKIYNNLGMALASLKEYDKALEAFKKGGPPAAAYNNLGVAYMKNQAYDLAETCFQKALDLSPRFYVLASENLKKCRAYRLP